MQKTNNISIKLDFITYDMNYLINTLTFNQDIT